ncbi:hypothetical protein JST97_02905 [bacterium]|nr:hypothetical protein [bacterium]
MLARWVTDTISVGLDFLTSRVGAPDEAAEVKQLRSRGLFLLIAIPPAAWIAILTRVLGPSPGGQQELVYILPALLWVVVWFGWMVRTYGPSRYTRSLKS